MSEKMNKVRDLRSALELLKSIPGQLIETDEPVNPHAELSGVYRHVGAGGTVMRPTKIGPAMVFNHVLGHEDSSVVIGLLASRERVGLMLDTKPERLGFLLNEAVKIQLIQSPFQMIKRRLRKWFTMQKIQFRY